MQRILGAYSMLMLVVSVYFGFGNTSDIANTATLPQKLVGVTATAYAIAALCCLAATWRSPRWLYALVVMWATLVVATALLATVVYAHDVSVTTILAVTGACVLIVAPVVRWARGRSAHAIT